MSQIKDELLSDAIKTALNYSYTIIKLKRVIAVMSFVIITLIVLLFTR